MRPPVGSPAVALMAVAAGLLLAGCGSTTPTQFYTLSSIVAAPGEANEALPHGPALGIGPVTLPEYLNRPQIVTRAGSNRIVLADFESWSEPLDGLFARTLTENLSLLLGTDDVVPLPLRRTVRLDYDVEVNVTRFDVDTAGQAILDARWLVYRDQSGELVRGARSTVVEPFAADDEAAAVQALSRALGAMSREIATAIAADQPAAAAGRRDRRSAPRSQASP